MKRLYLRLFFSLILVLSLSFVSAGWFNNHLFKNSGNSIFDNDTTAENFDVSSLKNSEVGLFGRMFGLSKAISSGEGEKKGLRRLF